MCLLEIKVKYIQGGGWVGVERNPVEISIGLRKNMRFKFSNSRENVILHFGTSQKPFRYLPYPFHWKFLFYIISNRKYLGRSRIFPCDINTTPFGKSENNDKCLEMINREKVIIGQAKQTLVN
jgi:hypothetical protein